MTEWLDVSDVLPGMEVELKVHDKDKSWNELNLSEKEDQLLRTLAKTSSICLGGNRT